MYDRLDETLLTKAVNSVKLLRNKTLPEIKRVARIYEITNINTLIKQSGVTVTI
jgi:hypothetical protein